MIDRFAILKVGPALTFALREALFSLAAIEELVPAKACSGLRRVLEDVMLDRPGILAPKPLPAVTTRASSGAWL